MNNKTQNSITSIQELDIPLSKPVWFAQIIKHFLCYLELIFLHFNAGYASWDFLLLTTNENAIYICAP